MSAECAHCRCWHGQVAGGSACGEVGACCWCKDKIDAEMQCPACDLGLPYACQCDRIATIKQELRLRR